jgi:hypothetical protein
VFNMTTATKRHLAKVERYQTRKLGVDRPFIAWRWGCYSCPEHGAMYATKRDAIRAADHHRFMETGIPGPAR